MALQVHNVTVANERVERHPFAGHYDHVTSRAFASLEDMIRWCRPLPAADGTFLAMKGVYPDAELAALPDDILIQQIDALQVPTIDAERHMVILARKDK
jgi:16S rRNA (guanine527-N7)-methyltransferase